MNFQILLSNLTNPTLLFFLLGFIAVRIKSDLSIPESSVKFISLYLLFFIGFKGGQELAHSVFTVEILYSLLFGLALASIIPLYAFFILKTKLSIYNAGAIAASYGSVSAVTCSRFRFSRIKTNTLWRAHGGCDGTNGIACHYCRCYINYAL